MHTHMHTYLHTASVQGESLSSCAHNLILAYRFTMKALTELLGKKPLPATPMTRFSSYRTTCGPSSSYLLCVRGTVMMVSSVCEAP